MTEVKELFEFQQLESQVTQARKRLTAMAVLLREGPELVAARRALAEQEKARDDLRAEQRSLEIDLETAKSRHDMLEQRMMGNEVANPRDLEAVQREVSHLEERQSSIEDQLLALLDKAEEANQVVSRQSGIVSELEDAWKESQADLLLEMKQLETEMPRTEQLVQKQAATLAVRARSVYDRLKAKKGGTAVARVEGGMCTGCRITLPTTVIARARSGKDMVTCSSCGRVLYVE